MAPAAVALDRRARVRHLSPRGPALVAPQPRAGPQRGRLIGFPSSGGLKRSNFRFRFSFFIFHFRIPIFDFHFRIPIFIFHFRFFPAILPAKFSRPPANRAVTLTINLNEYG
jgi:hypothetical protein